LLVANFDVGRVHFLSPHYQESELRSDFIDKFLIALGWDVHHIYQRNPYEQEVKVERSVAIGISQRRADYGFCISPNFRDVRFCLEAKKPFGGLATADNYFQIIRYGWNSQTAIGILTDFEQLHVIDCRYKPNVDNALDRVLKAYHYQQYSDPSLFAEIYYLISRDAVAAGSLERYAESLPKRRGAVQRKLFPRAYQAIDDSFLEELDSHRLHLARSFKRQNLGLDGAALTETAQRTLDRLVFMRFLEDRGIEPEPIVARLGETGPPWRDFIAESRRLDGIYNGIVFKHHELLDTPSFQADDTVFGEVCEQLAHVNSPYDFNVIPIHILGSIYERFLGKVIVASAKQARIVDSPEVRRSGGVYYTPSFVVRFIVDGTVGRAIEGKTPAEIATMRFADIACGSGSFLLAVFDTLLAYHTKYYNEHPKEAEVRAPRGKVRAARIAPAVERDGSLHLTLVKKREILLNNIFGIDLDPQAVEVAQLSLYLRLLQEETVGSARNHQLEFHETLLPPLNRNIVCGNSIIGPDVLDGVLFSDEVERRFNPLSYQARFPDIMRDGGFDVIVGNPPYVRPHRLSPEEKSYYWRRYTTFVKKSDLYNCFIQRAGELIREGGEVGYIVSSGWLRLDSFEALRRHLLTNFRVEQLVSFPFRVFRDAAVEAGIFILRKERSASIRDSNAIRLVVAHQELGKVNFAAEKEITQSAFATTYKCVFDTSITPEWDDIKGHMRAGTAIRELFDVCFGLKTGDDERFLHFGARQHAEDRPLLRGDDIKRYLAISKGEWVWYVPSTMTRHRKTARPGEPARFEQSKVLVKDTSKDFGAFFDEGNRYVKDVLIVIPRPGETPAVDLRFVTGLLNSQAMLFYYRTTFPTLHVQRGELGSLPIPLSALSTASGRSTHDSVTTCRAIGRHLVAQHGRAATQSS
jgi:adenine-specific DNA-methyltransferase